MMQRARVATFPALSSLFASPVARLNCAARAGCQVTRMALSASEAAVYDRQIRLWGVDAQQRLRDARVLICGMSAAASEVCMRRPRRTTRNVMTSGSCAAHGTAGKKHRARGGERHAAGRIRGHACRCGLQLFVRGGQRGAECTAAGLRVGRVGSLMAAPCFQRAEAGQPLVQELNPMVAVHSVSTPLDKLEGGFFADFHLVCMFGARIVEQV